MALMQSDNNGKRGLVGPSGAQWVSVFGFAFGSVESAVRFVTIGRVRAKTVR